MTDPIVDAPSEPAGPRPITISVVSHGHQQWVAALLEQLRTLHGDLIGHVVLTHNLPAGPVRRPPGGLAFRLTEVFNTAPAGFGANHNHAFSHCDTRFFCVLNPDIELSDGAIWPRLLAAFTRPDTGCAYPLLFNPDGSRQENERELVTPLALVRRHLLRRPQRRTDWVSAAFLLVRSEAWRSVGGFDERFHMYCEDVDFCLRLQLAGWRLARADTRAGHDASWGSRRLGAHLGWHMRSLLRLWTGSSFRRYLASGQRLRRQELAAKTRQ